MTEAWSADQLCHPTCPAPGIALEGSSGELSDDDSQSRGGIDSRNLGAEGPLAILKQRGWLAAWGFPLLQPARAENHAAGDDKRILDSHKNTIGELYPQVCCVRPSSSLKFRGLEIT